MVSYRSVLNVSNGGPSNPKLTLKINNHRIKRKAQNFASWMLSEYTFKIGRKKGNDFLIMVPLKPCLVISRLCIHTYMLLCRGTRPPSSRLLLQTQNQGTHSTVNKKVNGLRGSNSKQHTINLVPRAFSMACEGKRPWDHGRLNTL